MERPDAVIVGAGLAGLVAAAELATSTLMLSSAYREAEPVRVPVPPPVVLTAAAPERFWGGLEGTLGGPPPVTKAYPR